MFAMGPLGIITAIVSAIRCSGPNSIKALIGRSREGRAAAEVELLSSTSADGKHHLKACDIRLQILTLMQLLNFGMGQGLSGSWGKRTLCNWFMSENIEDLLRFMTSRKQ